MKKNAIRTMCVAIAAVLLIGMLSVGAVAADDAVITGTFTYMPAFTDGPATETFYYSDSWLAAPSDEQNAHLTSMSMALAYASMEIEGSSYITDLFGKIGFEDVQTDDMNSAPTSDTIGTAIAHKTINGQDVIAVSIRGNKYGAEWAANLTAGASGDIEGFAAASEKVLSRIGEYINAHNLSNVKLWIAGYSRAGSVADLTGVYVNEHLDEFDTTADDVYVYCYEAPRCCASDTVYPNIYCVKNKNDLINYVYPASWGLYTNGVEIETGDDLTVDKIKIDLLGLEKIVRVGTVPMDEFCEELVDFLSDELTREKFSGDFDGAVSGLIEMYFDQNSEAWSAVIERLSGSLSDITANPRVVYIALDELLVGIMMHNSDAMYRQLADELELLLQELAPKEELPITEEEYQAVIDSIYPLIRAIGPVLVKDYLYKVGVDYSEILPEDYDDPTYDPQTADPPILTYEQSLEAEQNQGEEEEYVPTDAEQGEDDGRSDGYNEGYEDGYAGNEPLTEAPLPEDAESRSQEYLDAYRNGYMSAYADAYEYGYKDANPEHSEEYTRGSNDGDDQAMEDAKKDALAQSFRASYNEEPAPSADGTPYSEDYIVGYRTRYSQYYDGYYNSMLEEYRKLTLYHFATLFVNREAILTQHYPQTNWKLVTILDTNYQLLGDANLNGAVDITDATTIQRYDVKMIELNKTALTLADVDGDGNVTIIDATWIRRYVAKMKAPEGIGKSIA